MGSYNIVLSSSDSTVVSEYTPQKIRSNKYQSEAELEKCFIDMLCNQGYSYINIHNQNDLILNLRKQLESLNSYKFTDNEWERFFKDKIANPNEGIVEKTRTIQEDNIKNLIRDDGSTMNITLIDKKTIHNNKLQVINQYEEKEGKHDTRYDVTVLVNGIPMVHIELKRRGVPLKEAFNQINRYQRDSFWAGSGLYEYIQIFVISNGTSTKYYSNTTRDGFLKENATSSKKNNKKTSNSFEFTSFWADCNNNIIPDLVDFTKTFFARNTILNIITKYCVFTTDNMLLVMRPYQIVATERIINKIQVATNYKQYGTVNAGGYVWHATGSGKTLTSFKTAQLVSKLDYIDKVIFVVDRKDLDYQTIKEYEKFEQGSVNGNSNSSILQRQLEDLDEKGNYKKHDIIVTTIQKLDIFIKKNKTHKIYDKNIVIIFDECHRSQFGQMHDNIIKHFNKYYMFGFTGTPIFAANALSKNTPFAKTTEQLFGSKLHAYTVVDAINDGNVLPFKIDYVNTGYKNANIKDESVNSINEEEAFSSKERISGIVKYVLEHFDQKTYRNVYYDLKGKRTKGFNSIFATSSINACKKYYLEFKEQIKENNKDLTIATIFSFNQNEKDVMEGILDDDGFDTDKLDKNSRDFLEMAIKDYNKTFKQNFDASSKEIQNYYKDLSERVKRKEIDILLVVNMFLTGFDATTLNTLWVDKNLKMHGLIQAFSRTNRILNSVKSFGNIVCFRNLEKEIDEAISLFGDKDASGIILLKTFKDYYYGYMDKSGEFQDGYFDKIEKLMEKFPLNQRIIGEKKEKEFIVLFGSILRLRNILLSFDDFTGNEILSEIDFHDYTGMYYDLHDKYKERYEEKDSILNDITFEIELVKQVEVNIDYILMMVSKYHKSNCKDKEVLVAIEKAVKSSSELRSKKHLIEHFIKKINIGENIENEWKEYILENKENEINEIIEKEKLKREETCKLLENAFRDGIFKTTGTDIDKILPPISRFNKTENRDEKKQKIIDMIQTIFEKYNGLI